MSAYLWLPFVTAGFLSGSVMYCKIIPKLFLHKDICELSDDGNPGAFNVFKHCGAKAGIPCLILDILKGFVPVLLASLFADTGSFTYALVIAAPVLGHALGAFNKFRGGKCIAVSFGVTLGMLPVSWIGFATLAALYIFFSTAVKITPNTKRSIVVFGLFCVISGTALFAIKLAPAAVGCIAVAVIAMAKHVKAAVPEGEEVLNDDK